MVTIREVRIPRFPDCWDSCGQCASGDIFVESVLVTVGQTVQRDETLIMLETGKVALDIPSPCDGTIIEVCVEANDPIAESDLIVRIETS